MRHVKNWLALNKDGLKVFIPLLILLVFLVLFLFYLGKIGNADSFNVVLGISLGVFVSFIADVSKKDWDKYQERKVFKRTVLKLLEQDAKSIFRIFEMWSGLRETIGKPGTPPGVENSLPPNLEMKYWDKLSQKDEFLLLADQNNFEEIFSWFWDIEKLKKFMMDVENGDVQDKKTKQSYMFAMAISLDFLKERSHEKLLKLFLGGKATEEYKNSWRRK